MESVKVSIVIPVLNSHEVVRRQLLHWEKSGYGENPRLQIILVDDGSDPPITSGPSNLINLHIHYTNDTRPWTQPLARNAGAKIAVGEYILLTDIDHILMPPLIEATLACTDTNMRFGREAAVLDEWGNFVQDMDTLEKYGLPRERMLQKGYKLPDHGNSFLIKRDFFLACGGSRYRGEYPQRDEVTYKRALRHAIAKGEASIAKLEPTIYMIPNGRFCGDRDYNPFGLFHTLTR